MNAGSRLLVVSAKDEQALKGRIAGICTLLEQQDANSPELEDVAFTLAMGRAAFPHRAALLLSRQPHPLERHDISRLQVERGVAAKVEVAMMFPGQGTQFLGMGRELYLLDAHFRQIVDECDNLASPLLGLSLRTLLFDDDDDASRQEILQRTSVAQPALFVIEYALAQVLRNIGVVPSVLIGHSIGEYAAACVAGVFELADALRLVIKRGQLMQSMPSGSMLAVRAAPAVVRALIATHPGLAAASVAAHNSTELTVVAAPTSVMNELVQHCQVASIECRPLRTSHAFHSAMMDPILEAFAREVAKTPAKPPAIPIISGLTGDLLTADQALSPEYWAHQLRHTVQFARGIEAICSHPGRLLIEVGPGTSLLTAAAKQVTLHQPVGLIETLGHPELDRPALEALLRCAGRLWTLGVPLDLIKLYDAPSRKLVRLPTYPFTRTHHWKSVVKAGPSAQLGPTLIRANASSEGCPTTDPVADSTDSGAVDTLWLELALLLEERLGRALLVGEQHSSFIELGFDSLALTQLSAKVNAVFGVRVPFRRFYEDLSRPELLSAHLRRESMVASIIAPEASGTTGVPVAMPTSAIAELTSAQREVWVAASVGGRKANLAYNECRSFSFDGPLNVAELRLAIDTLTERHEALRQTFSADGTSCRTASALRLAIDTVDLRSFDPEVKTSKLAALEVAQVSEAFDLASGPLVRAQLVYLNEQEHVLLICAHHVAVDGFSFGVLTRELGELYSARVEHRATRLTPPNSFAHYRAASVREQSCAPDDTLPYWLTHLAGHASDLTLPTDAHRPIHRTYDSTRLDYSFDQELVGRIREMAASAGVSTQTMLMSAFQLVLRALTGEHDIVLGVPTAGQAALGLDTLVGNWVHVLPIRVHLDDSTTFETHARHVHQTMLNGLEHQHITFTELLPHLERPRDASRIPLLPVAFGMGRSVRRPAFSGVNTRLRVVPRTSETFELYVYVTEDGPSLEVSWSYNTALFGADTIARWQRCFNATLQNLVQRGSQQPLSEVAVQAQADRERVLTLARGVEPPVEPYQSVSARIAAVALQFPERVAVIDANGEHTHQALNARANQIARFLQTLQGEPGGLVAVCLERSVELVASLLGVWRAGHGYVPLDPAYPTARIATILEDSGDPLILTSRALADRLPHEARRILVEDFPPIDTPLPTTLPKSSSRATDPAYVIFTSGSTGRPKGVVVPHRALENFLTSMLHEPGFESTDCLLALTTVSFDIAGLELFLPLLAGGSLVLATTAQATDPAALRCLLNQHPVTMMQATPSTWQMLIDSGWSGTPGLKALCGGEVLSEHLAARLLQGDLVLWNMYGPTETTVWSTVKRVTNARTVTIGKPIANTTLYVLDEHRKLLPQGAIGDLWIGGKGVALGYLGAERLSAERFIDSPFVEGERIYKTGDLARLRNDGDFVCLGRSDFQIKLRGFRIELGEVESAILRNADVVAAVVVVREVSPGQSALVAYVVTNGAGGLQLEALRSELGKQLPGYMLPSALCVLDALPLTLNKKVDRNALPAPSTCRAYDVPDGFVRQPSHQHVWVRGFRDAPLSAEELQPQAWLVLSDDGGVGQLVTEQLLRRGHVVTRVHSRDRFHEQSPGEFSINPELGRAEFTRLIERLDQLGRLPVRVVYLWLLPHDVHVRAGSTSYHRHQEHGLYALLHLAGLLAPNAVSNPLVHHVVGGFFGDVSSADHRARSTILGACRTIPNALHQQQVRTVDLRQGGAYRTKVRLASTLTQELLRGDAAPEVRYHRGARQVTEWERARPLGTQNVKGAALVVELTPYTLASVRSLSRKGVKVALIVSRTLTDELRSQLAELLETHVLAEVFTVAAVNEATLGTISSRLRSALGPIRTLVFAVPASSPVALTHWSEPVVEALVASEVSKLDALERLLPANELELTVMHVALDTCIGHPETIVDSSLAAFLQAPMATAKGRRVVCNWAPLERDPMVPAVSHVSSDRQYFVKFGLTEAEIEAAHERIWSSSGGSLAIVPFELASYRRRALESSAKDVRIAARRPFIAATSPTERRLCQLWCEALGLEHLSTEDSFFDLGGHSLLAARLFARIHTEFGVALPLALLIETPTVAGLAETIDAALHVTRAPVAQSGVSSLVLLNQGTNPNLPPLFVVGGATGNVLNLRHLARLGDPERDFYGIQARGLSAESEPDLSLVTAAEAFVKEVRVVQPHGPYYLGGFCIGGVTALEMARILRAGGEEVAQLIMLDSHLPEVRGRLTARDRLQIQVERLREGRLGYVHQWARDKYHYVARKARQRLGLHSGAVAPAAYRSEAVIEAVGVARANYVPTAYAGHIVLFRPPLAPHHALSGGRLINRARGFLLDDNGWGRVASSLEVHELTCPAGDHDGFVLEPHVRDLARRLSPFLLRSKF
jgi:amino acid adenylation domain-containing protein